MPVVRGKHAELDVAEVAGTRDIVARWFALPRLQPVMPREVEDAGGVSFFFLRGGMGGGLRDQVSVGSTGISVWCTSEEGTKWISSIPS